MNEFARDERRRTIRHTIDEALEHIERDGATGVELQLRDGAHASGDWARTSKEGVTVFSSVMGITTAQTMLLDDVLVVQTVWSDVTPAFVENDRFDAVFDRLLVEAAVDTLGVSAIEEALKDDGTLATRFAGIADLDPWQSDEIFGLVAARLPKMLNPTDGLGVLERPVVNLVEGEREALRRHVDPTLIAYIANDPITSEDRARPKTMMDLSKDHPEIANAILLGMMRLEIRRGSDRYVPLDKLRFDIEGMFRQWFRHRGS